ncbi:MAG: FAD-dependent oxidoreductase, partial [Terriglobales bacterium]
MASPQLPSALNAPTQAFPQLSEAQIGRIRPLGRLRRADQGEILFEAGATEVPFFVLLSGSVEIVQPGL